MAVQVLPQFQEHPDAWQRVPAVLQQSSSTQTKVSAQWQAMQIIKLITKRYFLSAHSILLCKF